jgi:hypothetical protein
MMEQWHDGNEWTARKRQVLGHIRTGLETARQFVDGLEGVAPQLLSPEGTEKTQRRRGLSKGKIAAAAAAAALELLVRRQAGRAPVRPKRPGVVRLALLAAAVLTVGKLIAARR